MAGVRFTASGRRVVNVSGVRVARSKLVVRRKIDGPTLAAGFYRGCVLHALEGLCPQIGESHADVDLAVAVRRLGFQCVLEPQSVLKGPKTTALSESSYQASRSAERVFWRRQRASGQNGALVCHAAMLLASSLMKCYQLETYKALLGRMMASLERSGYRKYDRRIDAALEECVEIEGRAGNDSKIEQKISSATRSDLRRMAA
jgi:hypothetical protein